MKAYSEDLQRRIKETVDGAVEKSASTRLHARPLLEPLRDPDYFARAFLEFGALTWPNGFDIAPEWLRRTMAAGGELRRDAA